MKNSRVMLQNGVLMCLQTHCNIFNSLQKLTTSHYLRRMQGQIVDLLHKFWDKFSSLQLEFDHFDSKIVIDNQCIWMSYLSYLLEDDHQLVQKV